MWLRACSSLTGKPSTTKRVSKLDTRTLSHVCVQSGLGSRCPSSSLLPNTPFDSRLDSKTSKFPLKKGVEVTHHGALLRDVRVRVDVDGRSNLTVP